MSAAHEPTLQALLWEHRRRYPAMQPQDAIKLCFQRRMGGGHLLSSRESVLSRLEEERHTAPPCAHAWEPLGLGHGRLYLGSPAAKALSTNTLFALFEQSVAQTQPDEQGLKADLQQLRSAIANGLFADANSALRTVDAYKESGCLLCSHSDAYRAAYAPSYRILCEHLARLVDVCAAIDAAIMGKEGCAIVAIEGACAAGKTTLAQQLQRLYRCPVVHMDDFFLQPHQRTASRLAQPGGNIDAERVLQEVLLPLSRKTAAQYRPYSCKTGELLPSIEVPPAPLVLVEGVYSMHPLLRPYYAASVFVSEPLSLRKERLLARGPALYERFLSEWIPLEDAYFCKGIEGMCSCTIQASSPLCK